MSDSLIAAVKGALEAMDSYPYDDAHFRKSIAPAVNKLRAALAAAPEQAPAAPIAQPLSKWDVMSALSLVPDGLSHPAKCKWIAEALNKRAHRIGAQEPKP